MFFSLHKKRIIFIITNCEYTKLFKKCIVFFVEKKYHKEILKKNHENWQNYQLKTMSLYLITMPRFFFLKYSFISLSGRWVAAKKKSPPHAPSDFITP